MRLDTGKNTRGFQGATEKQATKGKQQVPWQKRDHQCRSLFQSGICALSFSSPLPNSCCSPAARTGSGDEIRLKILKILWNGQATTQSLAETLHLSPSAISLHLKQLKAASLVDCYKEGKFVRYYANPSAVNRIHNRLIDYFEK